MTSVFDRDDIQFQVVVNHEEQYSIWPDYKAIPNGWRAVGKSGLKKDCLAYIDEVWTDMRPLSLRQKMAEARRPVTALNLLCLPYSGASAMVYSRWRRKLPAWLQVRPVELPGRGARMAEPLHTDMQALARQLASEQRLAASAPYALLGHSLGALLAFELAHELQALGCPAPLALFACGTAAPTRREDYDGKNWREPKTDPELISELRELQGTPEEVLANAELMSLTLPTLRADFLLCGTYAYRQRPALQCPLHVLGGTDDRANDEQLQAWRKETHGEFSLQMFPGGHFFIHEHEDRVLDALTASLQPLRLTA